MRRIGTLGLLAAACVSPEPGGEAATKASGEATPIAALAEVVPPPAVDPQAVHAGRRGSPIKLDEQVLLFPAPAWHDAGADVWRVPIHGWIYEPEEDDTVRMAMLAALRRVLGEDPRLHGQPFEERLRPFLWDCEGGKSVPIEVGGVVAMLAPSGSNGHFEGELELPDALALRVAEQRAGRSPPPLLRVRALTRNGDERVFEAQTQLVGATGLTVISDIDDTVKITQVRDTKAMLENTFFEPFRAVPGMSTTYANWIHENDGGHLHFVSSSPWQLYPLLRRMLDDAGFPAATFDLKTVRLTDPSVADLFADPLETKRAPIERLIERFPERRFALVGDSGEKDPEVYGAIARAHPDRIVYIAIRDVSQEPAGAPRYADAFAGVTARWEVFTDPATLGGP